MEFGLVAVWLGGFLLLGTIARPAAARLLPGVDHEAFAIPLALAVIGVVAHLVGHLAFGLAAGLAGVAAILLASAAVWSEVDLDHRRFIEAGLVFAAAFLLMVWVRSVTPAAAPLPVAIGEKMLDFGLLQSLLRTPQLPPEDMWFAGRPVRYHYGGHMLTAVLATLAGTAGRFAYNLALAGFYATLVVAAYGLAGSIAAPYEISRRSAALFGAFFVGLAGNLKTPVRVLLWLLPEGTATGLAGALGYEAAVVRWRPSEFYYFDASRVFQIDPTDPNSFMAATEFPLFAWLNGDLHAHMMSQPFMLLAAALLLAYWRAARQPRRQLLILFGAIPPLVGFIAVLNIWSFPTALGLVVLGVAFAPGDPLARVGILTSVDERLRSQFDTAATRAAREIGDIATGVAVAIAVGAISGLWALPYWADVVLGGPAMGLTIWDPWAPFAGFVGVHGAFLAAFGLYLLGATVLLSQEPQTAWIVGLLGFGIAGLFGVHVLGLVVLLGLAAWWLLRRQAEPGYEWLLVLAGAGLVFLVELVTVEGERFNTVFKYYAHVWLFWSIAGGIALARLDAGWPASTTEIELPHWQTIGRVSAVGIVVITAVYAGFALPAHADSPGPAVEADGDTLDATAYVSVSFPREAPAIRWLADRPGRPVIVTAAPGGYWWRPDQGDGSAAPASLTGLPTVLGWFHERQYRGPEEYNQRIEDVRTIYTGAPDRQRQLLGQYGVRYVYVGPAERASYGDITVGELEAVTVSREWPAVTIYRVEQSAL
jgi:YYY domain-containing protein